VTDRVIIECADHEIGDVITLDGEACRVVSKIKSQRGYRYGLKRVEAEP
jgi:hypothetical protein